MTKKHTMQKCIDKSVGFLRKEAKKRGVNNVVVGLSGGIDSALVAVLCKIAFGENLIALYMPSSYSSKHSYEDALMLAQRFDIELKVISLESYDKVFVAQNPDSTPLSIGNFCARLRMAMLYDVSSKNNAIVIGTSNKSELMLGYGTIFGDLACAINPIGNIFKSDIFRLAKQLNIPSHIITKAPSADLYENQSDEQELGFSYEQIDALLRVICKQYGGISKKYKKLQTSYFIKQGFDAKLVNMVIPRIKANLFKHTMPKIFIMD